MRLKALKNVTQCVGVGLPPYGCQIGVGISVDPAVHGVSTDDPHQKPDRNDDEKIDDSEYQEIIRRPDPDRERHPYFVCRQQAYRYEQREDRKNGTGDQ